jgi:hypothetical protein
MISAFLREMLVKFAEQELSLSELEQLLVENEPELIRDPGSDDASVVASLELGLMEYSDRSTSADDFLALVGSLLESHPLVRVEYPAAVRVTATSSSTNFNEPVTTWIRGERELTAVEA